MGIFRQLHKDAPAVPEGLQPKPGVEYGCGDPTCEHCYAPLRCPSSLSGMQCELAAGHGRYHKHQAAGWEDASR